VGHGVLKRKQSELQKQQSKGFPDDYKENFRFFKKIQAGGITKPLSAGPHKAGQQNLHHIPESVTSERRSARNAGVQRRLHQIMSA
jgi:hypothetical protein